VLGSAGRVVHAVFAQPRDALVQHDGVLARRRRGAKLEPCAKGRPVATTLQQALETRGRLTRNFRVDRLVFAQDRVALPGLFEFAQRVLEQHGAL
jgi:hypothetical protein